jgi:hypothetical protein
MLVVLGPKECIESKFISAKRNHEYYKHGGLYGKCYKVEQVMMWQDYVDLRD